MLFFLHAANVILLACYVPFFPFFLDRLTNSAIDTAFWRFSDNVDKRNCLLSAVFNEYKLRTASRDTLEFVSSDDPR